MNFQMSPDVLRRVQEHMASGRYATEEELLTDAILALDALQAQREQLRGEIQERIAAAEQGDSAPIDLEAFKIEARRRISEGS